MKSKFNKKIQEQLGLAVRTGESPAQELGKKIGTSFYDPKSNPTAALSARSKNDEQLLNYLNSFSKTKNRDDLLAFFAGLTSNFNLIFDGLKDSTLSETTKSLYSIMDRFAKMSSVPNMPNLPSLAPETVPGTATAEIGTETETEPPTNINNEPSAVAPTNKNNVGGTDKEALQKMIPQLFQMTKNILTAAFALVGPEGSSQIITGSIGFLKTHKNDINISFENKPEVINNALKTAKNAITKLTNYKSSGEAPAPKGVSTESLHASHILDFNSFLALEAWINIGGGDAGAIDDIIRMLVQVVLIPVVNILETISVFFEKFGRVLITDWLFPVGGVGGFIIRVGREGMPVGEELKKGLNFIIDLALMVLNKITRILRDVMYFGGGGKE